MEENTKRVNKGIEKGLKIKETANIFGLYVRVI